MTRGAFSAVAVLLLFAAAVQAARFSVDEAESGRSLLQGKQLNCTRIDPNCDTCRNQRITGTRRSEAVCSTCKQGYRLRRSGDGAQKTCDCAPGLAKVNGKCEACPLGMYCLGGDGKVNTASAATACPDGLETTFAGAKSMAQCFTKPGYGRSSAQDSQGKVTLAGEVCPIGTYNVGANTAGCQKCGAGLTTEGNATVQASDCLAPAGSYMDKGIGKLCQKGTYSTGYNSDANCLPCPTGITTADEGSNSADLCSLAMKGYYLANATTAELCALDTYQDQEANVDHCTQCPNGWKTKETGATGVALCLAPPGWELKANASTITQCEIGFYKADWNRNPCLPCGQGLITAANGSVSQDACLVPAGFGLTDATPGSMVAEPCERNTYGSDVDRLAVTNARCTPCPADMFTVDILTNSSRSTLYTAETACKVAAGWGVTSTLPQQCPVGTWNDGLNREPCKPCGTGWTTTGAGKTSASQCVIQPGWQMAADGIPAPCDKGTYSTGGSEGAPNATCSSCNTGFSTQEDESVAADECKVCAPGYGNVNSTGICSKCSYNTFAWGGASQADPCVECASNSVSRRGATQSQQCYSNLIDARNDVYNLGDESYWTDVANVTTAVDCGSSCLQDTTCVLYQFTGVSPQAQTHTCKLLLSSGTTTAGFKIGNADDYVVYSVPTTVGASIDTPTAADEAACLAACSSNSECEVFLWSANTCTLAKSELEEDSVAMFQVQGPNLYTDAP